MSGFEHIGSIETYHEMLGDHGTVSIAYEWQAQGQQTHLTITGRRDGDGEQTATAYLTLDEARTVAGWLTRCADMEEQQRRGSKARLDEWLALSLEQRDERNAEFRAGLSEKGRADLERALGPVE